MLIKMLTFSRCFPSSAAKVIMYQTQVNRLIFIQCFQFYSEHCLHYKIHSSITTHWQSAFILYIQRCHLSYRHRKTPHPSRCNQTSNPRVSFVITLKSSPLPRELLKDEHSMINCAAVLKVSDNLKRQGEGGAI